MKNGNIAWLGTGLMGAPMAIHLLRAEYSVSCFNRTRGKMQVVVEAGGRACDSPAAAAESADVVVTMVTDGPDVESVLFGENGALETLRAGALVLDMSTISPFLTRAMAARAGEKNVRYLDAPVTGGQIGAQNASLSIMVGGEQGDFEEMRPILGVLGKTITYCGEVGSGQCVKLCNQICGALNLLGVCEALTLGKKLGVDLEVLHHVISAGAGSSWAMQNLAPKIIARDFAPGFMVETQQKDMRLVAQAADSTSTALPGASLTQQLWRAAEAKGFEREGIHALAKVLEELSNIHPDNP
jgi:3-hydroxyisobutyrate dehydrogenase-like beta-hydroxyacid dehydrogenase